jgi:carbonic anhydrase
MIAVVSLYASVTGPGISADEALKKLKDGNLRFAGGVSRHAGTDKARRTETFKGQKPYVTVLGCSDSRHSIELIFDAGIGEIFVIRVAGNVADTDEIGSIEYGVDHLQTPVLLVMGHTKCGAVTAVATGDEVHGHIPPLVDNIVKPVDAARKKLGKDASKEDIVNEAIKENIYQSISDILTRSELVAKRVKSGDVKVVAALYHLDSGKIDWLPPHPDQDSLVTQGLTAGHVSPYKTAISSLIAAAVLLVSFLVIIKMFIADHRLFMRLKFKGRLIVSFLAVSAGIAASLLYVPVPRHEDILHGLIFSIPSLVVVFLMTLLITGIHVKSFREFYAAKVSYIKRTMSEGDN